MVTIPRFALFCLLLALPALAAAKGIFQAQGRIAEVQRDRDTITFRFKGWISAGYASAPDNDRRRRWHDVGWDFVDVPVILRDWTRRHDSSARDASPPLDEVHRELERAARAGRNVGFSLDNPAFFLTNRGQLARVGGTFIYVAEDMEPRPAPR